MRGDGSVRRGRFPIRVQKEPIAPSSGGAPHSRLMGARMGELNGGVFLVKTVSVQISALGRFLSDNRPNSINLRTAADFESMRLSNL